MNKKILDWLESLMEEEALGLAPNPYQEAMKAQVAQQAVQEPIVQPTVEATAPIVPGKIIFTDNFYDRDTVSKDLDNFYLFGDNTDDRLNTHYIPTQTQAVIRGLPNAIGIDTKHNRGWDISSFLSDNDFDSMQEHYNTQFKLIEDKLKEGHNVIIPRAGIGTGKAQLPDKAPKIYEDLNNRISNLYNIYNKGKMPKDLGTQQMASTEQKFYEVSSAGDKRFSALYATFKPGTNIFGQDVSNRTIESVYQHGVKQGDWITNNNYKTGRPMSKAIITGNTEDDSYAQGYLPLWQEWAKQNPELIEELRNASQGMQLNDKFARTRVSQARALTDILKATPSTEELLKHLYTSSFFNNETSQMPNNYSISRSQPRGFAYPELANLAPSRELLNAYKYKGLSWEEYTKQYNDYLEQNKEQVLNTINSLEANAILNCWEGSDNPKCHRHLLAEWLNKNGKFNVEEYVNKNKK